MVLGSVCMSVNKKEIQRARIWRYFLDAATEVIMEDGIDHFTIRKIADKAGIPVLLHTITLKI